ncbi:hypothetical protein MTO96_010672 [Rhipicephalus appendiculatus]
MAKMAGIPGVVKPKTQRGKRFLENRGSKLVENTKSAIFIRGSNANNTVLKAMKNLCSLKRPHSVFFNKKNEMKPFEDQTALEFMTQKNDASHFVLGTHSKKRPNNLVIGRTYDGHLLDMFELGMEDFKALEDFKIPKVPVGTKPMLIFAGEQFEQNKELERLKNFFIDFFRGETAEAISLQGLEHVIMFTAADNKITLRSYKVLLKKSGTKTPPRKQPKQNKVKKKKNIEKTALGATMGRIHMERQDFNKLQTRKLKGLKKTPEEKKAARAAKKAAARAAATSEDTPMDVDA